jgi:hypothetical protein
MNDHASESPNDGLDDLAAEILAAPSNTQSQRVIDAKLAAAFAEIDRDNDLAPEAQTPEVATTQNPDILSDEVLDHLDQQLEQQERLKSEADFERIGLDDLDLGEGSFDTDLIPTSDAPELTPIEAQRRHGERFIANLNGPKPKTARKSKLSPRQAEIIEYRKSPEGKPLWNEYQLAKRWEKAEVDGRTIIPRKSLKHMTPEEKAEHQRKQAAERKRTQRAKNI